MHRPRAARPGCVRPSGRRDRPAARRGETGQRFSLVTYFDGIGDIQQDSPPGWTTYSREFIYVATYPFYSVSAKTEGTTVTCRLFVNGELVDSNTTYPRYTIADCSDSP